MTPQPCGLVVGSIKMAPNPAQLNDRHRSLLPPKRLNTIGKLRRTRHCITTLFIFCALAGTALVAFSMLIIIVNRRYYNSGVSLLCSPDGWFVIDFPVGNFTYREAKIIDAAWNVTIGRGAQAFVGWTCYNIFAMALLRITQQRKVPVVLYTAFSFHALETTTIPKVIGAIFGDYGWRVRAFLIWSVFAITFVLALPTLLDVMTGYITNEQPMVRVPNKGLVPFDSLNSCTSARTNETVPFWSGQCETFIVNGTTIPATTLINKGKWIESESAVSCVPGNRYFWGFSIGWLWVVIISTTVWIWGMFGLWFDAQRYSILWRHGRRPGEYHNMLDISGALREQLGPDTNGYSEGELKEAIEKLSPVGFAAVVGGETETVRLTSGPTSVVALKGIALSGCGQKLEDVELQP